MEKNTEVSQSGLRLFEENFKRFANFANCLFNYFKKHEDVIPDSNYACRYFSKHIEEIGNESFLNIKNQIQSLTNDKLIIPVLIQHMQGMDNLYKEVPHFRTIYGEQQKLFIQLNKIKISPPWTNLILENVMIGSVDKIMEEIYRLFTHIVDEYSYFLADVDETKLKFHEPKFKNYFSEAIIHTTQDIKKSPELENSSNDSNENPQDQNNARTILLWDGNKEILYNIFNTLVSELYNGSTLPAINASKEQILELVNLSFRNKDNKSINGEELLNNKRPTIKYKLNCETVILADVLHQCQLGPRGEKRPLEDKIKLNSFFIMENFLSNKKMNEKSKEGYDNIGYNTVRKYFSKNYNRPEIDNPAKISVDSYFK
jgi:hypothetical protein